jgi:tetratricopeptide (TPR) repeat protein
MDEDLAEAHVSLAAALADYYWDWTGAEREFRRAIELNPNNVVAHYWYGSYLAQIGRFDAAEAEVKRALEIDPLSLIARGILSIVYYRARNFEAATDVLNNALQMDSGYMPAHLDLGLIFIQTRDYQRAIDHFLKMEEVSGGTTAAPGLLGMAYGLAGREAEARATLKRLSGPSNSAFMSPLDVAFIYIGLGDRDRAFEWLEKAYEERVWQMGLLKVGPEFDPLRSDPRFADLVRRVGVP